MNKHEYTGERPFWYDGKMVNEVGFCEDFLQKHPMPHGSVKSDMVTCGQDIAPPNLSGFTINRIFTTQRSRFAKEYNGFAVFIIQSQEERNEHQK